MKIVFTGIQWCWKGTQARILVENYGFKLLEMWWALREIAREDTELGNNVKKTIDAWLQVDPVIVAEVMKEYLGRETNDRIIMDGFVRNFWNKETMESIFPDYKVLFFNLSKEKAMSRLLGRMYDPLTGETFIAGTTQNPVTWTELIKRADDNETSIMTRINAFVEKTLPVVDVQKAEWRVIEIDADQSVEKVAFEIKTKLWL